MLDNNLTILALTLECSIPPLYYVQHTQKLFQFEGLVSTGVKPLSHPGMVRLAWSGGGIE